MKALPGKSGEIAESKGRPEGVLQLFVGREFRSTVHSGTPCQLVPKLTRHLRESSRLAIISPLPFTYSPNPPRVETPTTRLFSRSSTREQLQRSTHPPACTFLLEPQLANSSRSLLVVAPFSPLVECEVRPRAEESCTKGVVREQRGHAGHHYGSKHQRHESFAVENFESPSQQSIAERRTRRAVVQETGYGTGQSEGIHG